MVEALEPKDAATSVAQEYVDAFNARDMERSRAVLNYPSVRLASGQLRLWERPEDYSIPWDLLAEREGWHHSTLDSVDVIQAGGDKVHVAASFSRYDASGANYVTHDALPVWGCPSRPSLREAPGRWRWSRWSARSAARTNDLDHPEGWCRLCMGRSAAAWGLPALPGCSTNMMSSATTIGIGCPP
jgi:hypothetical protein